MFSLNLFRYRLIQPSILNFQFFVPRVPSTVFSCLHQFKGSWILPVQLTLEPWLSYPWEYPSFPSKKLFYLLRHVFIFLNAYHQKTLSAWFDFAIVNSQVLPCVDSLCNSLVIFGVLWFWDWFRQFYMMIRVLLKFKNLILVF